MKKQMKLPLDWSQEKLRTLVKIDQKTLGKNTHLDFIFRYISLADVNNGKVSQSLPQIIFAKAPSRARRIVSQGDILFATVRPNLEGYCRFNEPVNDLIASTGFAVLSPKILSDTEYIYQYLYSNKIKSQIHAMVVGSNYPALNSSDVANLKIVIPNSALERKVIASLLSVWDESIEKTQRLIETKEKRFRWLLRELISKPRTDKNSKEWEKVKLGKLFGKEVFIEKGKALTKKKSPKEKSQSLLEVNLMHTIQTLLLIKFLL